MDCAERCEEHVSEVEDEVDSGQLLHHLHEDTEQGSAEVAAAVEDRSREAVGPALKVASIGDNRLLVLVVGNDLSKLILNIFGFDRLATNRGKGLCCVIEPVFLDIVTRRLGEEEQSESKNESPDELDADRDAVGSGVIPVLGAVDSSVGNQNTDGDAELVSGDEGTANFAGSDLRHVQDNYSSQSKSIHYARIG